MKALRLGANGRRTPARYRDGWRVLQGPEAWPTLTEVRDATAAAADFEEPNTAALRLEIKTLKRALSYARRQATLSAEAAAQEITGLEQHVQALQHDLHSARHPPQATPEEWGLAPDPRPLAEAQRRLAIVRDANQRLRTLRATALERTAVATEGLHRADALAVRFAWALLAVDLSPEDRDRERRAAQHFLHGRRPAVP